MIHVIAEAGSNHGGKLATALALVSLASKAGADSVKFQFINPEGLYLPSEPSPTGPIVSRVFAQRAMERMPDASWREIWCFAQSLGIAISSSVFDEAGIALLTSLDAPYIKVASTDLNNSELIKKVIATGKPVILSTGLSTLGEIEQAVRLFDDHHALQQLVVMHCVSVYPCALRDTNLRMVGTLKQAFGVAVGFSDHTEGSLAACMAVSLGASWIEKHFTIDKSLPGFDHRYASNPEELESYVAAIRDAEQALQPKIVKVGAEERVTAIRARRGLYAKRDLKPGHVIREDDILCVRPSGPLSPSDIPLLVGQTIETAIAKGQAFDLVHRACGVSTTNSEAYAFWNDEMTVKGMTAKDAT